MKNFKKTSFLIYIFLLICFCFLTILGIKTKWGSSTNNHLKGIDTINWGGDLKDMVNIKLSLEKKAKNQEQQEEIEKILKKRLDLLGFEKNKVYSKKDGKTILVSLPASYHKELFDFSDVASYLVAKGDIKIFKTKESPYDFLLQQNQKKDKKEELLVNSSGVYSANLLYDDSKKSRANSSNKTASIRLNMFEEDKEKLLNLYKETTKKRKSLFEFRKELAKYEKELKKLKKEFEKEEKKQKKESDKKNNKTIRLKSSKEKQNEKNNPEKKEIDEKQKQVDELKDKVKAKEEDISSQNIKILLDQNTVYENNILSLINDKFEVVGSHFQNSPDKVLGFVNIINSQKLPVGLKVDSISKSTPEFGARFLDNFAICAALFFGLVLILIGLKYRLFFILALFVFGLHFAFFISIFTGVFSFFPGVCVNFASILGAFVSFLIAIFIFIANIDKIFKGVKNKKNLTLCVEHTFKNNRFLIYLNLIILTISAVLMGGFAPSIDLFHYVFKPLNSLLNTNSQSFIFSFAHALFFGSIATLFFELLTTNISLKLLDWFIYYKKTRVKKIKPKKPKIKKGKLRKKMEAKPNEAKV